MKYYKKKILQLETQSPNFAKPDWQMPFKVFAIILLTKSSFICSIPKNINA